MAYPCQICKDFCGVGVGLDLGHYLFDVALLVDDEGCPHHAHADLAVELLFPARHRKPEWPAVRDQRAGRRADHASVRISDGRLRCPY